MPYPKKVGGTIHFPDHPEFKPHYTPAEVMKQGAFGGTYWRPIYSSVTKKEYSDQHKKYPFLRDIPASISTKKWTNYNTSVNKYGVKVGQTLEQWEASGWIKPYDPYGHFQWYCEFYNGRRIPEEDNRQIRRWNGIRTRFGNRLGNMKREKRCKAVNASPKISQTLLHWYINPDLV